MKKKKDFSALLYSFGMMSYNMEYALVANLTYALTESFSMSAISTGAIFLFSRFLDGFTDILAGYVIDKTNTRLGKVRIYDLLHLPLWILMVLVFSVPAFGNAGRIVWVFIFYNLLQSVTATFLNVAEPLRLQYSFETKQRLKAMSVTSVCSILVTYVNAILTPILIKLFAGQPHGWTIIILIYAVPFAVFGILRFALLPELPAHEAAAGEKLVPPTVKESLRAIVHNKYILLYAGVMMCWAMYNTIGDGSKNYYFTHVYGDVAGASYAAAPGILLVGVVMLLPRLIEKYGKTKTLRMALLLSAFLNAIRLVFRKNLIWLSITCVGSMTGVLVLSFMKPLLTIDCIAYGRKKIAPNVEAAYSTMNSLADKIGLGVGSLALGLILQLGGYNGDLAVQPESAVTTITVLYTLIPCLLMLIAYVLLLFYDLDKKLPALAAEERKEKQ